MNRLFFIGAIISLTSTLGATTLTFDNLGLAPNQFLPSSTSGIAVGDGFTLSRSSTGGGTAGLIINAAGSGNIGSSGQNPTFSYLTAHNAGQSLTHTLSRQDGATFSLSGFDYHGWNNNFARSINVIGSLSGGGTVSSIFNINNTFSSPYQHAALTPDWAGLTSVTFSSPTDFVGVFQIDNIELALNTPVPENGPTAALLGGVVMAFFGAFRRSHYRANAGQSSQEM